MGPFWETKNLLSMKGEQGFLYANIGPLPGTQKPTDGVWPPKRQPQAAGNIDAL